MNRGKPQQSSNSQPILPWILILGVVLIRGLLFPDFSLGLLSVIVIQIAFPLSLATIVLKDAGTQEGQSKIIGCYVGIIASTVIGCIVYGITVGLSYLLDPVSLAVFGQSLFGQVLVFAFSLEILKFLQKYYVRLLAKK